MKKYFSLVILLCMTVLTGGCGQSNQTLSSEEVMTAFLQEFFSADCSYEELGQYAVPDLLEDLEANRMPGKYADIWGDSDSIACRDIVFDPVSDETYQFTATLSWKEDEDSPLAVQMEVEGSIGISPNEDAAKVDYLYLKL